MLKNNKNMLSSQQGSAVLGAIFLTAVISVISLSYYKHLHWQNLQDNARSLGHKITMVINALERRLSFDQNFISGEYSLKSLISKNCGGTANNEYLPCGFSLRNYIYNGDVKIRVSQSKKNPQVKLAKVQSYTIGLLNHSTNNIEPVAYLAGAVLASAESEKVFTGNQYLSAAVSYALDRSKARLSANVVANQNNSNIYLKVDGSNKMENALSFNKKLNDRHRMIKYVSELSNSDNLKINAQKIFIGNQSGIKGYSNVVVNDITLHSMQDRKLSTLLSVPVGTVLPFAGGNIPEGFFECNGNYYSRLTYPKLYAVIGSSFGQHLPDLRGRFIRGWDHGAYVDKYRSLGSYQEDAIRNITGRFDGNVNDGDSWKKGAFLTLPGNTKGSDGRKGGGLVGFDASRVVPTAADNRPKNIALMYIIKHD